MAQQHPPIPARPTKSYYAEFIFPLIALSADAALSRIQGMLNSEYRKNKFKESAATEALAQAAVALLDKAEGAYLQARKNGELLLCWHGTQCTAVPREKLLEGGAA